MDWKTEMWVCLVLVVLTVFVCPVAADNSTSVCDLAGCAGSCSVVNDAAVCSCPVGFMLDSKDNASCTDIRPFKGAMEKYLTELNVDHCANAGCQHQCVDTLFSYKCVCNARHRLAADGTSCISDGRWRVEYTALITIAIFLLMILFIACCLCARYKRLQENICCKSFVSWACCMTGCFCKCNKGEADEATNLYYHQVKINISPCPERKEIETIETEEN